MKRSGFKSRGKGFTQRKPMAQRSNKKTQHLKTYEGKAGLDHMAAVAVMPCCICDFYGLQQMSRTTVHHVIHGRYSARKSPDTRTIPLCDGHHQGTFDTSKIALHREPDLWKAEYGEDTTWLKWVADRLI